VPSYLVEVYVPNAEDARAAARQLRREAGPVRYVRMTFLPGDETCFHLVEAVSEDAVAEVCRRAGLRSARIVPAVE
jgi:hypothetical protein